MNGDGVAENVEAGGKTMMCSRGYRLTLAQSLGRTSGDNSLP